MDSNITSMQAELRHKKGSIPFFVPSLIFFSIGSLVHIFSYNSLQPLLVGGVFGLVGYFIFSATPARGYYELAAFRLVFSVFWFWAAIAAVYANQLDDPNQNYSDAVSFFELAAGRASGLSLERISRITEGSGAIVLWRFIYDGFADFGLEKRRYIGITFNVFLLAVTSVFGLKMVKAIFGYDVKRLQLFTIIFASCGIFWLFAAIHLRDSTVVFLVTALSLYWVKFLVNPNAGNTIKVVIANIISFGVFSFFRADFLFVPLCMLLAGTVAIALGRYHKTNRKLVVLIPTIIIGMPLLAYLFSTMGSELVYTLEKGNISYFNHSVETGQKDSLGMSLILGAPPYVRLVLGPVYLLIFPIPFWSGFLSESAYHLYKSFNVLFMYFWLPLLFVSLRKLFDSRSLRTPPVLFLFACFVGFTIATAMTSLETRHFGVFLPLGLVLSMLADMRSRKEKREYKKVLTIFISAMFLVHASWAAMKYV